MTSTFASRPGDSGSVSSSRRIWKIRSALPVGPAKNWYQRRTWGEKATYMILITSNAGIGYCRDLGCRYFETHSNIRLTITIDFLKDLFILSLHLEAPSWSTLLGCSPEGHALTWHWSHHPPSAGWSVEMWISWVACRGSGMSGPCRLETVYDWDSIGLCDSVWLIYCRVKTMYRNGSCRCCLRFDCVKH